MPPLDTGPAFPAAFHPLLWATWGAYLLSALLVVLGRGPARRLLLLAVALHVATSTVRGLAIDYLPLTSKTETFFAAGLGLALVLLIHWRDDRRYTLPLLALVLAALYASWRFEGGLRYPVPPLLTVWYLLHVPLSFVAYGLWAAAGAAAWVYLGGSGERWLRLTDRLVLQGFGVWSLSMVFGGIWGVVAWGAYFLWDPKVVWSVILWLHAASHVHLKLTPSLHHRGTLRASLALLGVFWVLVAFVGTSFFFGSSSHAF